MRIKEPEVRRGVVRVVEAIASEQFEAIATPSIRTVSYRPPWRSMARDEGDLFDRRPALSINLEAAVGILGRKLEAGVSAAEPGALGSEPLEAAISGDSLSFLT
jgi:hypothetical protein